MSRVKDFFGKRKSQDELELALVKSEGRCDRLRGRNQRLEKKLASAKALAHARLVANRKADDGLLMRTLRRARDFAASCMVPDTFVKFDHIVGPVTGEGV